MTAGEQSGGLLPDGLPTELCMRARFAQPQPRGSGSAWCLQQIRIRTVCAGCCYLTDGLGLERIARKGGKEIAERGQEYFRRKLDVRTVRTVGLPSSTIPANKLILLRIDN